MENSVVIEEKVIYCDCCGTVKMAVIRDEKIIIIKRHDRRKHTVAIPLRNLKGAER